MTPKKWRRVVRLAAIGTFSMFIMSCGSSPGEHNKTSTANLEPDAVVCQIAPYAIEAASWDCDAMFERLSSCDEIRFAFLWRSFGDETACLDKLLSDVRTTLVEAHLVNDTCFPERGRVCGAHEYNHGRTIGELDVPSFRRWVYEFRGWLLERPPGPAWYVSPALESNHSAVNGKVLVDETRAALTDLAQGIVWNPVSAAELEGTGADLLELHGSQPAAGACIANNDGLELDAAALERYRAASSGCVAAFEWTRSDNCLKPGAFVPLLERDCSR